ncbi:MAG TPA: pentapeptide repeat-containing protein [Pseudosphingobacterium sp.]|nr:pentapeptide repeat-containing protein [Pseudosphingobacterium sp.]
MFEVPPTRYVYTFVKENNRFLDGMKNIFIEDKTFSRKDFTLDLLEKGDYEGCTFTSCNFSNVDLANIRFANCEFLHCNLSLAKLAGTSLQDVKFKDCKMLGLRFEHGNPFGFIVQFENCTLNHSSFYRIKLQKTIFKNVQLQEVDFTESNLTGAVFDACDLARAIFNNSVLEKTDFRNAINYIIDPELNRIKKAKFSLFGVQGLLNKYNIEIDIRN